MANTRFESYGDSDPEGNLDYIPRGGQLPKRTHKPQTGKDGLVQANRIDAEENLKKIERATNVGIEDVPLEKRLASAGALHAIREQHLGLKGQTAVSTHIEVEPVTEQEYPSTDVGDQAKLF